MRSSSASDISISARRILTKCQAGEYRIEIGIRTARYGLGPHYIQKPSAIFRNVKNGTTRFVGFDDGNRLLIRFKIAEFNGCTGQSFPFINHADRQISGFAEHVRVFFRNNFQCQPDGSCGARIGAPFVPAYADQSLCAATIYFPPVIARRSCLNAMIQDQGQSFGCCIIRKAVGWEIGYRMIGFHSNDVKTFLGEGWSNIGFVSCLTERFTQIDLAGWSYRFHQQNTVAINLPAVAIITMSYLNGKGYNDAGRGFEAFWLQPEIVRSGGRSHQNEREVCKEKSHGGKRPFNRLLPQLSKRLRASLSNIKAWLEMCNYRGFHKWFFASLGTSLILAAPAYGQVIEIDADGEAFVYDGPTLANDDGLLAVSGHRNVGAFSSTDRQNAHVDQVEREYSLPKGLIDAVIYQESRGRMNAVSPKGALGLMQLMPGTAAQLGVNPYIADQNIRGGAMYLRQQIDRFGSIPLGLAAYNAGPGAVIRYRGIPPYRETQNYVATILGRWQPVAYPSAPLAAPAALAIAAVNGDNAFFIEVNDP